MNFEDHPDLERLWAEASRSLMIDNFVADDEAAENLRVQILVLEGLAAVMLDICALPRKTNVASGIAVHAHVFSVCRGESIDVSSVIRVQLRIDHLSRTHRSSFET